MMGLFEVIVSGIVGLWMASIEWRIRNMSSRIDHKVNNTDLEKIIDLKNDVLHVRQDDIKDDIKRLEHKIDKLIDRLTHLD